MEVIRHKNEAAWIKLGVQEFDMTVVTENGAAEGDNTGRLSTTFTRQDSLVVLGACLDARADSSVAMSFAIRRGWKHWFQRSTLK